MAATESIILPDSDVFFPWVKAGVLGKGSYGKVYKVRHMHDETKVRALKIVKLKDEDKVVQRLADEIGLQQKASSCPYVVHLEHVYRDERNNGPNDRGCFLVMELCWGDFLRYLQHNKGPLCEEHARKFSRHLAMGLFALKKLGAVHRDLKPENLMVTTGVYETAVLKLADFGFARLLVDDNVAYSLVGSPQYMAPEIAIDRQYTTKADLWSVGAILYQMLTGIPPPNPFRDLQEFVNNHFRNRLVPVPIPAHLRESCSPEVINLLTRLLEKNPAKRISFADYFAHPWLNSSDGSVELAALKTHDCSQLVIEEIRELQISTTADAERVAAEDTEPTSLEDSLVVLRAERQIRKEYEARVKATRKVLQNLAKDQTTLDDSPDLSSTRQLYNDLDFIIDLATRLANPAVPVD